jgi:hypothetical protein
MKRIIDDSDYNLDPLNQFIAIILQDYGYSLMYGGICGNLTFEGSSEKMMEYKNQLMEIANTTVNYINEYVTLKMVALL